jgi:hypothetical protein
VDIREEIEEIESLMQYIPLIRPRDDWPDSFLDYRVFGGFEQGLLIPARIRRDLERRLEEVQSFCTERVEWQYKEALNINMRRRRERVYPPVVNDEPNKPENPLNTERLARDIFCLYLFGRMDQLKERIVCKLEKIRI